MATIGALVPDVSTALAIVARDAFPVSCFTSVDAPGGDDYTFGHQYRPYDQSYIDAFYRHIEPGTGRRYRLGDITAPGGGAPSKGNPHYEFLGVTRYWRYSEERDAKSRRRTWPSKLCPGPRNS